jgi:hypothetical protein
MPPIAMPVDVPGRGGRRPVMDQERHRKDDQAEQSEKTHCAV